MRGFLLQERGEAQGRPKDLIPLSVPLELQLIPPLGADGVPVSSLSLAVGCRWEALMLLVFPGFICSHGLSALLRDSRGFKWLKPLDSIFSSISDCSLSKQDTRMVTLKLS